MSRDNTPPTQAQICGEMMRLTRLIDKALVTLHAAVIDFAEKDTAYRKARAVEYESLRSQAAIGKRKGGLSEADLKAQVDGATAELMLQAHLADGFKMAAFVAVRARMAQLSACQTLAGGVKAEMNFAKYGPPGNES